MIHGRKLEFRADVEDFEGGYLEIDVSKTIAQNVADAVSKFGEVDIMLSTDNGDISVDIVDPADICSTFVEVRLGELIDSEFDQNDPDDEDVNRASEILRGLESEVDRLRAAIEKMRAVSKGRRIC